MRFKFIVFVIIVLLFFGCTKNHQKTPQSTIDAFLQNIGKLNEISPIAIKQATKVLKTLFSTEKAYEAFTTTFRNIEIENYTIGEGKRDVSYAEVPVRMKTKGLIGLEKEEEKELIFSLEKKDSKWYIKDIAGILERFKERPSEEENIEEK